MTLGKATDWSRQIVLLFGISLFLLGVTGTRVFSQSTRFQNFSLSEGLCHPFIYTIHQDKNGFIWFGTGEGLCRFDGLEFTASAEFDSLPLDVVSAGFADSLGILWHGFNNGEVWSYDGNVFEQRILFDGETSAITGFTQSSADGLIVATQSKGLFTFNEEGKTEQYNPACTDYTISAIHVDRQRLFVGAQEGLFIYNLADARIGEPIIIEDLNYIKVQVIENARIPDTYWIGTEDAGLFKLSFGDSLRLEQVGSDQELSYANVQDVLYDADSNLWVCTFTNGLLKLEFDTGESGIAQITTFDAESNIHSEFLKCALLDREGNSWFGTYGDGFLLQSNQAFEFYNYTDSELGNNITAVVTDDNILWLGGESGLMEVNQQTGVQNYFDASQGLPNDRVTSLYLHNSDLFIGTASSGVYKITAENRRVIPVFRSDNSISNSVNHITGDADNIYVATKNGIFSIALETGKQYQYNTLNGLPHNDIEHIFLDDENRLLFATRSDGIYEINVRGEVDEYFTVGKYELDFNSIAQDNYGQVWVSTYGQGLFVLSGDSVINLTARDGLKSNYCYGIVAADSMYLWIGHRLGLSRVEIRTLGVTVFDADNGITGDCNPNAIAVGRNNTIFFGTTEGVIAYNPRESYHEEMGPKTNILHVIINDREYDFRKPIILPYSAYKMRVDYIGLNYADPQSVRYRYKLEGYDLEYSDLTELRSVIYPRLEDGEYTFRLQAKGTDGVSSSEVTFSIRVKLPVWKTWWFISSVVLLIIITVVIIVKIRERKQKQIQEYLEKRLDERTREVVEQKEEIEIKNRDITDSINYAQRIQTSILPPIKRLQQKFSGSFIFYQPRDIVSGDFYWFDSISESKFVIVCADSTGHGVPGAFMSMIGTTLIKDICMREDVNSPSEILRLLDEELRNTLNQNVDAEQSNDGMDIIVCEIDIRTNYLRYASAMRPMIIYRNGEQVYIKGSRSSVGGQYDKDEKVFKDEGVQLDKGDLIYMFSDGYPDQFGGPVGKKFKMVRLKNLLKDIYQKPMEEQYEYVKSTFNLWKEDFDQVDDVLFMGVKI